MGIIFLLIYLICIEFVSHIPAFRPDNNTFYYTVSHNLTRHVLAFIAASFGGTTINDYLISKLKIYFSGKYLIARFIFGTMGGEAFYALCSFIIWIFYLNISEILFFLLFSYIYRISFEVAITPIGYLIAFFLKHSENIDIYDYGISYNPFLWK